jgi:hypothetical protein
VTIHPEVDADREGVHVHNYRRTAEVVRQAIVDASGRVDAVVPPVRDEDAGHVSFPDGYSFLCKILAPQVTHKGGQSSRDTMVG